MEAEERGGDEEERVGAEGDSKERVNSAAAMRP